MVGVWIQQFFFGIVCYQFWSYYTSQSKRHDTHFTKTILALLLIGNLFLGVTDFHVLYRSAVVHYGDLDKFDLQTWTMWSEPGVTALVGCIAQVYFLDRCRRVNMQWRKFSPQVLHCVTAFLFMLILLSTAAGLAVCISFWSLTRFSGLAQIPIPISLWLVSTTVADVALTGFLLAALIGTKTAYSWTGNVISRIIRLSVESSIATSVCALLNLLFYFEMMETSYHLLPQFSISRIYTITVLASLLSREDMKSSLQDPNALYLSAITQSRAEQGLNDSDLSSNCNNKIDIQVTTDVDVEHDPRGSVPQKKPKWHSR